MYYKLLKILANDENIKKYFKNSNVFLYNTFEKHSILDMAKELDVDTDIVLQWHIKENSNGENVDNFLLVFNVLNKKNTKTSFDLAKDIVKVYKNMKNECVIDSFNLLENFDEDYYNVTLKIYFKIYK